MPGFWNILTSVVREAHPPTSISTNGRATTRAMSIPLLDSSAPENDGEADSSTQKLAALIEHALFDHLIRSQQQCLRDRQTQGLRGLEIDDQFKLGGLLDGKVGGPGALEDLV